MALTMYRMWATRQDPYGLSDGGHPARMAAASKDERDGWAMSCRLAISEARFRGGLKAMVVFGVLWSPITGSAQTSVDGELAALKADAEQFFGDRVAPFIKTYCLACHSNKRPTEAGVNFSPALTSPGHSAFSQLWKKAIARVKAHDMPPDYADKQPADADRQMFVDWLAKVKFLSRKDPGLFVIRRLTKTEYGNTLHDLFGVEPAIANDLPDEVSGEGYLNSLSPLQLEQYLAIADKVLDRILSPEGAHLRIRKAHADDCLVNHRHSKPTLGRRRARSPARWHGRHIVDLLRRRNSMSSWRCSTWGGKTIWTIRRLCD